MGHRHKVIPASLELATDAKSFLNKHNLSFKIQEIIEKYYLQPINGSTKHLLKDGFIERSIHGAMHASRATLWALLIHHLLSELLPDTISAYMTKIAKFIDVDTEQVLLNILMTTACHDAARQGEGTDYWEAASGRVAAKVLKELGLAETAAQLLAKAITFKDRRESYSNELDQLNIDKKDHPAFDYIRKIVNLGDNLDLMRCIYQFKLKYIFDTLKTIEGFAISKHRDIICNVMVAIHQFIYDQHDMRFPCDMIDTDKLVIASLPYHLSHQVKVKYEHADNVFAIIFAEAKKQAIFKKYLVNFTVPCAKIYDGAVAFDPFIHGTNSSIFATKFG